MPKRQVESLQESFPKKNAKRQKESPQESFLKTSKDRRKVHKKVFQKH